jgi:hypothetical protein
VAERAAALRADCARCFGLCCVVPAFTASADFAIDKAAGQPCPNLRADFRCGIHDRLRPRGFPGCVTYDCFGAGQKVAGGTFGGQDWRTAPGTAREMFDVFTVMRQLHELLWYLTEALALPALAPPALTPPAPGLPAPVRPADSLCDELGRALRETERLTGGTPAALAALDVSEYRGEVNALLLRASELARAGVRGGPADRRDLRGADLVGQDLRGTDLRAASLRGACLIGADLRAADLTGADLTGADLRGADLRGADLAGTIFLTQSQVDAANGDPATELPPSLTRPAHWPGGPASAGAARAAGS